MMDSPQAQTALLLVDVQNDFLPGGALGVMGGDTAARACRRHLDAFLSQGRPVFLSRDWHPQNHCSFEAQGGPWPPHCIAGTPGAQFSALLGPAVDSDTITIVSKATHADRDAYSAFEGHAADGATLHDLLQRAGIRRLEIGGIATDYCVQASVLDARRLGYAVTVLCDAVAAVDIHAGDGDRALQAMQQAGGELAR